MGNTIKKDSLNRLGNEIEKAVLNHRNDLFVENHFEDNTQKITIEGMINGENIHFIYLGLTVDGEYFLITGSKDSIYDRLLAEGKLGDGLSLTDTLISTIDGVTEHLKQGLDIKNYKEGEEVIKGKDDLNSISLISTDVNIVD